MTVDQANQLIRSCAEKMNARYEKVVFDEWAIISLVEKKGRLLAYNGPRKEGFQKNFLNDAGSLRTGLLTREYHAGDFEFARDGVGILRGPVGGPAGGLSAATGSRVKEPSGAALRGREVHPPSWTTFINAWDGACEYAS